MSVRWRPKLTGRVRGIDAGWTGMGFFSGSRKGRRVKGRPAGPSEDTERSGAPQRPLTLRSASGQSRMVMASRLCRLAWKLPSSRDQLVEVERAFWAHLRRAAGSRPTSAELYISLLGAA